ncbi:MAG: DUF455 family protein [Pseudobdellovibrionaceae bacterium]
MSTNLSYYAAPELYFQEPNIRVRLEKIEEAVHRSLTKPASFLIPLEAQRDIQVLPLKDHPPKVGFSKIQGQGRLLHDLANIELQAMELGLRTLVEFPQAPEKFRDELAQITLEEASHFDLCLMRLDDLGYKWGDWPIHTVLWDAVSVQDSLLDRIFIVHRYLEGSGLDAGDIFTRKLSGVLDSRIEKTVQKITDDEIDHVYFGSAWYNKLCLQNEIHPNQDLIFRSKKLRHRLPKRIEKICHKLRLQAGFSPCDLETFENLRESFLGPKLAIS